MKSETGHTDYEKCPAAFAAGISVMAYYACEVIKHEL